jgi:hypothetical protein
MRRLIAAGAAFLLSATTAAASDPTLVASFKSWDVFTRQVDSDVICYAVTDAQDKAPKSVNHGEIFFMVATWKSGAAQNQPSFRAGYNIKDAPAPAVRVGSESWKMYADQDEAFIEAAKDEQALIAAMRRGSDMRVTATSSRGTQTSYVFSLQGVSAALDRVREACK